MPKYRNSTNINKQLGSYIVPPNEDVITSGFFTNLPAGVTLVSDDPSYNPVLLSEAYIVDSTIPVPVSDTGAYYVDIYVEAGEVDVRFNSASMTPVVKITEGSSWQKFFTAKSINDIRVHFAVGGRVWVNIEKG